MSEEIPPTAGNPARRALFSVWGHRKTNQRFSRKWVCPHCGASVAMGTAVKLHRETCLAPRR